jgi:hypothetical protein
MRIVGGEFEFEFVRRLSEVIPDLPLHASQRRNNNFGSRRSSLHDAEAIQVIARKKFATFMIDPPSL